MFGKHASALAGMAAALTIGLAHPASATDPATDRNTVELRVSTEDLDLTKTADQALLRHRIAVSASKACALAMEATSTTDPAFTECFQHAAAQARLQEASQIAAAQSRAQVASSAR